MAGIHTHIYIWATTTTPTSYIFIKPLIFYRLKFNINLNLWLFFKEKKRLIRNHDIFWTGYFICWYHDILGIFCFVLDIVVAQIFWIKLIDQFKIIKIKIKQSTLDLLKFIRIKWKIPIANVLLHFFQASFLTFIPII